MVGKNRGTSPFCRHSQGCDRASCPDDRTNVIIGLTSRRSLAWGVSVEATTVRRRSGRPGGANARVTGARQWRARSKFERRVPLVSPPSALVRYCQWQTKTAHFWQLKTAHVGEIHLRRSGRSSVDVRRAFWAGRRERSDRSPGQHAPRSCAAGGHVATPSRCCSDAARSQC